MADDHLRELERAWKKSGSERDELTYLQEQLRCGKTLDWQSYSRLAELNVQAAADYLRARVEGGELDREKLELAAYCSHEPARLVLGEEAPQVAENLDAWLDLLLQVPSESRTAWLLELLEVSNLQTQTPDKSERARVILQRLRSSRGELAEAKRIRSLVLELLQDPDDPGGGTIPTNRMATDLQVFALTAWLANKEGLAHGQAKLHLRTILQDVFIRLGLDWVRKTLSRALLDKRNLTGRGSRS